MLLDMIIAASCGGAGIACGWVMHALHLQGEAQTRYQSTKSNGSPDGKLRSIATVAGPNEANSRQANSSESDDTAVPDDDSTELSVVQSDVPSVEKVTAVAARVRQFVFSIAADVDEHQSRVETISSTLQERNASDSSLAIVDAVDQMLAANEVMQARLNDAQARIREQSQQLQSAEQRAQTDALTQVFNRGAFDEHLLRRHARGPARAGVLAMLDVDHFKKFNDTHGHRAGDEVLRVVASLLEARLQPHGMVARFGGEEFVVLVHDHSLEEAVKLIEQSRRAIATREIRFEEKSLKVTASVGIGALEPQSTPEQWLQVVDEALYRSKEAGRDCSHYLSQGRTIRVGQGEASRIAVAGNTPANEMPRPTAGSPISSFDADAFSAATTATPRPNRLPEDELASTVNGLVEDTRASLDTQPITPRSKTATNQSPAAGNPVDDLLQSVVAEPLGERPKALSYLPDLNTMVDFVEEMQTTPNRTGAPHQLMSVRLSGTPSGATMRSLLQLVRAATRNQDRIGCLDQSTLLVCMPELEVEEATQRGEQICAAAGSIGVTLAAAEKSNDGERLSVGILQVAANAKTLEMYEKAIVQAGAIASLAARQSGQDKRWPVLAYQFAEA